MKTDLSIKAAIYLRAAELVEQGHCKNSLARNKHGWVLMPDSDECAEFCYRGALIRAESEVTGSSGYDTPMWLSDEVTRWVAWNNAPDTTAAMVAQKLREQAFS